MKLTNEICISFLRGSGWLYNHDKEITISERNKAIDDFVKAIVDRGLSSNYDKYCITSYDNYLKVIKEIAEQLKAGGIDV